MFDDRFARWTAARYRKRGLDKTARRMVDLLAGPGLRGATVLEIGGGIGAAQDGGPGQVTFYVEVDDPAAYLQKAERLGGRTIVPPTEVEQAGLEFAFFADPEGHVVGLSKGAVG